MDKTTNLWMKSYQTKNIKFREHQAATSPAFEFMALPDRTNNDAPVD